MQGKQVSTRLRGSDAHDGTETNSSLLGCIERNREFLEGKHKEIRVKIESLGQKVIEISGKHVTKIMQAFFTISILICPLIAVSSHPVDLTTSNALINSSGEQKSTCLRDDNCVVGFFCHDLTKSCVPCLKNECLKWKRRPGSTSCAKSQEHCGDCLQGFTENHGHCQPVASSSGATSESRAHQGQGPGIHETSDTGFNWWKSTDSTYLIVAGVVVFCLLGTSASFVFIYVSNLNKRHTPIDSDCEGKHYRSPIAPEDLAQPPPYNPSYSSPLMRPLLHFDSDQSHDLDHPIRSAETSFSERPIQHERAAMAIAFSAGQFPTTADAAEEETPAEVNQTPTADRVSPNASPEPPNTTPEPPDSGNISEMDTEESVNESAETVQPEPEVPEAPPSQVINEDIPVPIHPPPLFQLSVQVGINLQLNHAERAAEVPPPVHHPPPPPVTQRFRVDQSYVDLGVFANWNGDAGPSSDFDEEISGDMEEDLDNDVSFYD